MFSECVPLIAFRASEELLLEGSAEKTLRNATPGGRRLVSDRALHGPEIHFISCRQVIFVITHSRDAPHTCHKLVICLSAVLQYYSEIQFL